MHAIHAERGKPDMLLNRGKYVVRRTQSIAGKGGGNKRTLVGNRPDRGCNMTSCESGQTSLWSLSARTFDQPIKEVMQMTTETAEVFTSDPSVGATTDIEPSWH